MLLWLGLFGVAGAGCRSGPVSPPQGRTPERLALSFLSNEVPGWSRENGCFSCHNNGDAARALYAAVGQGYELPGRPLEETSRWLADPGEWRNNKREGGVSDECLSRVQFAAALAEATRAGAIRGREALGMACDLVIDCQAEDGSWAIEPRDALGTPATYGSPLATAMVLRVLRTAGAGVSGGEIARAEAWLRGLPVRNTLEAAAVLFGLHGVEDEAALQQRCLTMIGESRSAQGGWGPYHGSPPEPFDTAVVMLALLEIKERSRVMGWILGGRKFLVAGQLEDGGWLETTRPPDGVSYAQRLSTAGWATEALLRTTNLR